MSTQLNLLNPGQTALFPEPTEQDKKRLVLDHMNRARGERRIYLEKLRTRARRLVFTNYSAGRIDEANAVCMDWIRESLRIDTESWSTRGNIHGATFSEGYWYCVGEFRSKSRNSHGNKIKLWKIDSVKYQEWKVKNGEKNNN